MYPLEAPSSGFADPNPGTCGYGIYVSVPRQSVLVTLDDFEAFKSLHAPLF